MKCNFCGSSKIESYSLINKEYLFCTTCGGIKLAKKYFLSPTEQQKRYMLHNNNLENSGYREYLSKHIVDVLTFYNQIKLEKPLKILDYGSGPFPALSILLDEYKKTALVESTCKITNWDPYFASDISNIDHDADLVFCHEVAEHFEDPYLEMCKLASTINSDGLIAVNTMLIPKGGREAFSKWWYRQDSTHVSFYTDKAMQALTISAGLRVIKKINNNCFILCKTDSTFNKLF